MPFSLYLQQSAVSNAQLKQYASTAQLFDMVKWTKEAYNHFGVPYFDTCCQAEPYNIDPFIPYLVSAQVGNNITVSTFDNKLWAPQVSGMVYATGTTNYIAKFQGTTSLIDSTLFEYITASGTTVVVNGTTSQKIGIQDNATTAGGTTVLPNFATSNISGYSAISSEVLDGVRNPRFAHFINDTLSLCGHSITNSSGTSPVYGIWQGINRVFSIRSNGNVMIRTSNISGDFADTGYKLDVFGSFRTNSTVNFTGIANTTTANTLYYNSSTGAVTYGAAPSSGASTISRVYLSSDTNYTNASYTTIGTFNVGSVSAIKTYKFSYYGSIYSVGGISLKIGGTASKNAVFLGATIMDGSGAIVTVTKLTSPSFTGPFVTNYSAIQGFLKIEGTVEYAAGSTGTLTIEVTATNGSTPTQVDAGTLIELTEI